MKKILISDLPILFSKHKRQKNLRLSLKPTGEILLSAPFYCAEKTAVAFAQKNIEWIRKNIKKENNHIMFKSGDTVSILGKNYQITLSKEKKSGITVSDDKLFINAEESFIHRRISNYAKKELLIYSQKKAEQFCRIINKNYKNISLKNTSTRWGSCSSQNNLNFCWKIAFAPLFVIDYLIAHEVAHLKEMNHSLEFWKTVALFNVNQAEAEIWLRKNGKNLMLIK